MKKIPYKTVNGENVYIWYYNENTKNNKKCPCMIWIHGGGWHSTDPSIFGDNYSHFTKLGIACFSVEYRLIGDEEDLECKSLKNCIDDCFDAVKYVRENSDEFNIDKEKIIVVGESAGGQLALCMATDVAKQYVSSAIPNMVIAYNPVTRITSSWVYSICNIKHSLSEEEFLNITDKLYDFCPYSNINKNDIPLLLLTGIDDRVTYPGDVYDFLLKYKNAGNVADIVFYPKTEHAFALPEYYKFGSESRNDSFEKIETFIKKHMNI